MRFVPWLIVSNFTFIQQEFSEVKYHYYMLTAQLMFHLEAEAQCHSVRMRDPQNKVVGPFGGKHINIGVIKFSLFP